jgi:hypothetical protein
MKPAVLAHSLQASHTEQHLIGGRYRTQTRIGSGRLGEIFAAIDENFENLGVEQHAAIQIIPQTIVGNNKLFNKLNIGYTMLKAGAHPNIVNYLQFGRDGNFGFLAMELLEGASLRTLLESAESLPPDEVKPVIRGVGAALLHLHAKHVVHGNLTTRNVFVGEDLEARLLDVVPLDSDDAIFRGAAMSEPFGRCTVRDDVFGLACLTYEMLSGKHPFNYCPPGEARSAGLEAERINSLTNDEWNALRLALSFEHEKRTSSVTEFMRDFGILGTERLRSEIEQPAIYETDTYAAVEEAAARTEVAAPVQSIATAAPVAAVDPFSWNVDDRSDPRLRRNGRLSPRTALLGMLLAGLIAWTYYGQPEEHFANVIAYVDESMNLGLTGSGAEIIDVWTTDPGQPVLVDRGIPTADSPVTEPATAIDTTLTSSDLKNADSESVQTVEKSVSTAEEPSDQLAPVEPPTVEKATETVDEVINDKAGEISAVTDTGSTQAEADMIVVDPVVTVSERDAAARIALRYNANSTTQLTWWTSEDTAISDQDFIAVKQQLATDASLADGNILHIPLINDSVPEPRESFYVNLGRLNTERGAIELVATVRVDIIDDDLL